MATIAQRKCGKEGEFEVSSMCVGAWAFGGSAEDYWGKQEDEEVTKIVQRAVDLGATFFDTAEAYNNGESERVLGETLKRLDLRAKSVVGTKILPTNCHPGKIREHLDASLGRLGMESVDLYMVHWPFKENSFWGDAKMPNVTAAFEELATLQREGKLRHIGVSNFGVKQLTEALATGARIVINELPYGVFMRSIEFEVVPLCQQNGIGILAYSPLMQGLLTGKYKSADEMPFMRTRTRHFKGTRQNSRHGGPGCEDDLFAALDKLRAVAEREDMPLSDLALAWCLANPTVVSVIVGCRDVTQLEGNARALGRVLTPSVVEEVNGITDSVKNFMGTACDIYSGVDGQRTE